jgi:hypothetical protein
MTQVYYKYEKFNYLVSFDEDEYNRDSYANSFGANQYFSIIEGRGYIRIGAEYKDNNAKGDDWDYYSSKYNLTVYSPTPVEKMSVELGGELEYSRFDNDNSFFDDRRKDTTASEWIELMYKLNDNWSAGLNYKHINNNSNIDFYEYKRNITSLFLSCEF